MLVPIQPDGLRSEAYKRGTTAEAKGATVKPQGRAPGSQDTKSHTGRALPFLEGHNVALGALRIPKNLKEWPWHVDD